MTHAPVAPAPNTGAPRALPATFQCSLVDRDPDTVCVHVTGELDIATAPAFGRALKHALLTARLVVLDLRDVAFIDSASVHAILNADARARTLGQRLMILRAPATVDRLFGLIGAADQLEFVPVSMTPGSRTMRACPQRGVVLGGPCGLGILTRSSRDRSQ